MQIYCNKRKCLHKKRVELPQDWFGTTTWPSLWPAMTSCAIWLSWRHVHTLYSDVQRGLLTWLGACTENLASPPKSCAMWTLLFSDCIGLQQTKLGALSSIELRIFYTAHNFTRDQWARIKNLRLVTLRLDLAIEVNHHVLENEYGDLLFFPVVLSYLSNTFFRVK